MSQEDTKLMISTIFNYPIASIICLIILGIFTNTQLLPHQSFWRAYFHNIIVIFIILDFFLLALEPFFSCEIVKAKKCFNIFCIIIYLGFFYLIKPGPGITGKLRYECPANLNLKFVWVFTSLWFLVAAEYLYSMHNSYTCVCSGYIII